MKIKNLKFLKLALLLGMMLTLPALQAAPTFTLLANPIEATDTGGDGPSDKGGGTTKDGGTAGGGGSGGVVQTIYDAVKSIFSGIGGGTSGTSC